MDTDLTALRLDQHMMGRQITVNDKGHLAVSTTSPNRDNKRPLHNTLNILLIYRLDVMEVRVFVDGVPRVVCGVTEETTCQEVVIALAQALGKFVVLLYMVIKMMVCWTTHGDNLPANFLFRSVWTLHITGEL